MDRETTIMRADGATMIYDYAVSVVGLVRDADYAQSLMLLLEMSNIPSYFTTDENDALAWLSNVMPAVMLLDIRLAQRLTPIFDDVQRNAINRNTRLVLLASSALLPVGDHLRLPLMTVDRHNASDILRAVRQSVDLS